MKTILLITSARALTLSGSSGYVIGALIALLILGYLVFSLVKPEKF